MTKKLTEKQAIAKELKIARIREDLTQSVLAKKLNKPQSFVQKYETCERRIDVGEFLEICKVLDADPHEIIDKVNKSK